MTQEEIQERNEQIALMLGWEEEEVGSWYTNKDFARIVIYSAYNNYPHIGLPFHRDWNWLMEAVVFCKSKIGTPSSVKIACLNGDINKALMTAEKEAVFIAVSDFAKIHNEKG